MKREVGLWIDHHKAIMVTMSNDSEETREIRSNVEKHLSLTGSKPAKKTKLSVMSTAKDMGDRLSGYYDAVVSLLRNADTILIFGPGEAKIELQKRLEQQGLGARTASVETAVKMTNRQIETKVRQLYQLMNLND